MPSERRPHARRWVREERGNTLVLFPVAVLIVLGLGGLALDAATIFLGQRRLADVAAALARDSVAALDIDRFLGGDNTVAIEAERVAVRRAQLISSQAEDRGFEAASCEVTFVPDPPRAVAQCVATVRPLFAPVLPGMDPVQQVHVSQVAVASER